MADANQMFPLIPIAITVFLLIRARLPRPVLIASLGFGLSGALMYAVPYFLWTIGTIAFKAQARDWAYGLIIANLAAAVLVVGWLLRRSQSPSRRDVPPPDREILQ